MAKRRVLLAHGNADCQKIYGSVLAFHGYDVHVVSECDEALRLLASFSFDAVLTDLYLPSTVDECLLRQLRATTFAAHLPVVVITGWTTEPHRRAALSENADAFLPLPVRPRDLIGIVDQVIEHRRARTAPVDLLGAPHDETIGNDL